MSAPFDSDLATPPAATIRSTSNRGVVRARALPLGSLHEAAARGDASALAAHLVAGHPVNDHDAGGFTALHHAAFAGHSAVVGTLLDAGADVHLVSAHPRACGGASALHAAVCGASAAVVRRLLRAGARADVRDEAGYTALHLAAELGATAVVKELLLAGAALEPTIGDVTPLDLARRHRHLQVVGLLRQLGAT